MNTAPQIDAISLSVTPLDIFANGNLAARGTAFFYLWRSRCYLVTNKHNLTARNPLSGERIASRIIDPDAISYHVVVSLNPIQFQLRSYVLPLDSDGRAIFWEHPGYDGKIDIAILDVAHGHEAALTLNSIAKSVVTPAVSKDVFAVGYPLGIDVQRLPLWKRASIATEYGFDVNGLPMFYIDAATAQGMSGSPVLLQATSGAMDDGRQVLAGGTMRRFLGVYSGRLGQNEEGKAQLGMVWRATLVDEILEHYLGGV